MTGRQRLHLLIPPLAIIAILIQAATILADPTNRPPPIERPIPKTFAGLQRPDQATFERIIDTVDGRLGTLEDTQTVTGAGISRNGQWAYIGATPPSDVVDPARYLLYRPTPTATRWRQLNGLDLGWRTYPCDHKPRPPAEIMKLLRRDKFRCDEPSG